MQTFFPWRNLSAYNSFTHVLYIKCVLPCKGTPASTEQCVCVCVCVCVSELLRLSSGAWSRRKKWVVGCSLLHAIWITACWPGASRAKSQERGFSVWGCDGAIRENFSQRKKWNTLVVWLWKSPGLQVQNTKHTSWKQECILAKFSL